MYKHMIIAEKTDPIANSLRVQALYDVASILGVRFSHGDFSVGKSLVILA